MNLLDLMSKGILRHPRHHYLFVFVAFFFCYFDRIDTTYFSLFCDTYIVICLFCLLTQSTDTYVDECGFGPSSYPVSPDIFTWHNDDDSNFSFTFSPSSVFTVLPHTFIPNTNGLFLQLHILPVLLPFYVL